MTGRVLEGCRRCLKMGRDGEAPVRIDRASGIQSQKLSSVSRISRGW